MIQARKKRNKLQGMYEETLRWRGVFAQQSMKPFHYLKRRCILPAVVFLASSWDELRWVTLPQWMFHVNVWWFYGGPAPSEEVTLEFYVQLSSLMECKWVDCEPGPATPAVSAEASAAWACSVSLPRPPSHVALTLYHLSPSLIYVIFNSTLKDWRGKTVFHYAAGRSRERIERAR